ncbi:MAG: exo-alpha-sialidase [Planctomycetes bacterium]|nr:exo-alpha-sialidase [Planctomycetota bacterium]
MGTGGIAALLLVVTAAAWASAESLPKHVDVFVSGQDGYFAYRIPAIETAPDLTILKDKSVGVLWERADYKFITFTRLDREFLEPRR